MIKIPLIPLVPIKEDAEGRYVTIFLSKLPTYKRNWRCSNCGWLVFQYRGEIGLVIESGVIPEGKSLIEVRCHRCKLTHRVIM